MLRTAPLRRTPMSSHTEIKAKDGGGLSRIQKRCKWCREKFGPTELGKKLHDHCIGPFADAQQAKAQRRQATNARKARVIQAKADREKSEKLKPIGVIEEECRKIVQAIARIRDRDRGCISCEKPATWDGQWHGSHYRAHGGCSALQFHLWNINRACWICNKLYSGRVDQQKVGIVARYGQERLDWLDAQPKSQKFTREYLARFKRVMGKRLRRMKARAK